MAAEHRGGCVCGAVRFTASGDPLRVTVCHCRFCQRRTGTGCGVEVVFRREQVAVAGEEIGRYRHVSDESGRWLDMEFCRRCGGNLGFNVEVAPDIRSLPAGAFDDPFWIRQDRLGFRHVFLRSRRDWADLSSHAEAFEAYFRK